MKGIGILLIVWVWSVALWAQKVQRPALLFTPERIKLAKERMVREPAVADGWRQIKDVADRKVENGNVNDLEYLSLAYLMTDDKAYAEKIKQILKGMASEHTWGSEEMLARTPVWTADLGLSHRAYLAAVAYDAVYGELSSSERKEIAAGLKRVALDPSFGDWLLEPTRIHSLNSMGHNWWTACACMGGLLALSLQNEIPEAREMADWLNGVLPEWFSFAGDVLQNKPKTFDAAGGMYESLNYANYGIQEALKFRLAWKNVNPGKAQPDIPELALLPDFFLHVCYPRTGMLYDINFGDSHKNVTAEATLMLLYALGIRNDNMLWYFSQVEQGQHRDGLFLNRPLGFLYMPRFDGAPEVPQGMKTSCLLADFGWATLRTSWEKDATMLAVKSGHTWNHSHADANSFVLFHKGVDILKDAGNCWYPNPNYRNYFFQSEAHNVVLFNGKGQSRQQQYQGSMLDGSLHYLLDTDNLKYILADGTGPYADQFSRNFRHFLWMDNIIYVIDDLKTHEPGHFEWLWHPGGEARKRGFDLEITSGKSSVAVRPLYPHLLAASDFVHDYPDDLYWEVREGPTENLDGTERYYSFHLPAQVDRVKGVTAILLKDSVNEAFPRMERREGKDWIGLRIRNKGKVTDLYINQLADGRLMHSNSWIEADGWFTDAYLFAVSYEEGADPAEAKDVFVCYGSALRRGMTSYFASLSKLFVVSKQDGSRLKLWMQGQPKMRAVFGNMKRPASLEVNGERATVVYRHSSLEVRCVGK